MGAIKAKLIIEIMGRPPEHLKETLNTLVIRLGSEKGVSLIDKQYHEPKPVENSKDLFIAFGDVDVEFETFEKFFGVLMGYMPAHVEIYEPEKFKLKSSELNELSNFILGKMHKYDAITKRALQERDLLLAEFKKVKPELFQKKKENKNDLEKISKKKTKKKVSSKKK
tara:strand:- start:98 stop:601 length:504 start_codon:yes stop_codon:yes gene_type:complete